jgi:hypothetical protein
MLAILFPFFLIYHFFWFALVHSAYIMHFYGPKDPWTVQALLKGREDEFLDAYK